MMAQNKHLLHELLKEDQEPFLLNNYISNKRTQLKRSSQKTILQLKKQQKPLPLSPITTTTTNSTNFLCRNACFLSFNTTPDGRKSPLFELAKRSPCRSPSDAIFLHIPAKTASLLLDAALRIQKQSKNPKPNHKNKNNGFAVFGSFFKKLTLRGRNRKSGIEGGVNSNSNNVKVSVKDLLRWDSSVGTKSIKPSSSSIVENKLKNKDDVVVAEMGFPCSCDGRLSSAAWSEKSMDMEEETSSSCGHSCDSVSFGENQKQNADCDCFDDHRGFFSQSPFRFVLQKSPSASSSGHRPPEFSSPAASPSRRGIQDKESNGADDGVNEEEEEEKEQCSPVSVLDTPFEDDYDGHENDDEDGGYDLECSYANVQRTKKQLLDRLSRFEKLAELDPVELEKRMLDEAEEFATFTEEDDSETSCEEICCHSSVQDKQQAPEDLKRLVYDLIKEEEREVGSSEDMDMMMRRVFKRLELWKEVEPNTIDMMIEEDFTREENGWKKNSEQKRELAEELELAIFCFLVDEFSEELVC